MPDLLDRFGVSRPQIVEGWRRAGVLTSLAYLDRDEIYAKLLELPERSPDGRLARPLYHWLLDANAGASAGVGLNETKFRERGMMWGSRSGHEKYYRVSELYHADSEGLPKALLDKLAIVSLRKRSGNEKVEQMFGVRPIEQARVKRELVSFVPVSQSEQMNARLQASKPYLHKLRSSRTGQVQQLAELMRLRLVVCRSQTVALEFDGQRYEYDVPPWEWLLQDEVLSVQMDPTNPAVLPEGLLANSIGEALASLFRLADGGEFAQMFSCPETDRLHLLRRLRNESSLEDMESIRREYESQTTSAPVIAAFTLIEPPVPATLGLQASVSQQVNSHAPVEELEPATQPTEPTGKLVIVEREHIPVDMPETRTLQIRRREPAEHKSIATYQVADGNFSEDKVLEFESASGRFPVLVGHMMGSDGPLCDILSFASQDALDDFRESRDLRLVDRFIEVKGRSSASAAIELKGNSLKGARNFRDRYYLYRLYEVDQQSYDLAVLRDPIACGKALQEVILVHLQVAESTDQFFLQGGKGKARSHRGGGAENLRVADSIESRVAEAAAIAAGLP